MKTEKFREVVISHAGEIAEEIARLPAWTWREVYYDEENDRIWFSSQMSRDEHSDHPNKIGVIAGLIRIPTEWKIEFCWDCNRYHPIFFEDGKLEVYHGSSSLEDLIYILEVEIIKNPAVWVMPTQLLE